MTRKVLASSPTRTPQKRPDAITWITAVIRNPETGKPFELLPAEIAFLVPGIRAE
jgi:hypothetical protein